MAIDVDLGWAVGTLWMLLVHDFCFIRADGQNKLAAVTKGPTGDWRAASLCAKSTVRNSNSRSVISSSVV